MMRKFSKILALVLAFAMVLCPVLTAAAETESEVIYSSAILNAEVAEGKANVTLTVETIEEINAIDFKINLAKGVSFDAEVDTVTINADESGDAAAWSVVTNYADGVLSVLAIDGDDMANVASYLVFDITLTVENVSDYELYLTKIFAVGAGSADTDEVIAVFPCADNAQSGAIDVEAARVDCPDYFISAVCEHASTTTNETPATCTEDGSSVVTCDVCGSVISSTPLPATGHNFVVEGELIAATEEAVGYFGYDIACDVCDALNPAYYAEDGSVRTDVDFAALAAEGLIEEIPMLEKPCDTATEYSKDETGHWFDCTCGEKHDFAAHDPAAAVEENRKEPTATAAGSYDSVVYCSVCEYEISRTTEVIPATGPTVDKTLVFAGAAVGFGANSLQINFRMRNNLLTKYDNIELVIIPDKYDAVTGDKIVDAREIVIPYSQFAGSGTFRTYAYTDIYLYELGLDIDYMLRAYNDGELVAVSDTFTTSAAGYLRGLTPSDNYMAALIADTLIVGQSAMENMSADKPECDLAKAPSITDGYDLSAATKEFDMESCNKVNIHNAVDAAWGNGSTGAHRMSASVAIGMAPSISYRIRGASSIDLNKFSVRVTYSRVDGTGTTINYDRTFTSADTANIYKSGSFFFFKFDGLGLPAGNVDVNFVATYDGAEVFNSVYSVETYFYSNMNTLSPSLQVLATNILKLGVSFRANAAK